MNVSSIDPTALVLLHQESLKAHGGRGGVRDPRLLDAALAHPLTLVGTDDLDIASLAAAYAFGIMEYQPFMDGNDRAAFMAIGLFLYLNNWQLNAEPMEAASAIEALSAGHMSEPMLANWIRARL